MKPPAHSARVSPQLQRMIDALETSPALVRNAEWDIVGWNEAALAVLADYASLPEKKRNVLRLIFSHVPSGAMQAAWEQSARFVVALFRAKITRTGTSQRAQGLIEELRLLSPEFAAMWQDRSVGCRFEGTKILQPPHGGPITVEYSSFAVDGQPGLSMVIYTPTTARDVKQVRALVSRRRVSAQRGSPRTSAFISPARRATVT